MSPLYYILVIEEEGSFSAAARKLGISQPALSAYVTKLENKLGGFIFDRTTSPLRLTDIGKVYTKYVRDSRLLEEDLERELNDITNLRSGNLTIGGAHSFVIGYIPKAQAEFSKRYPGVNVRIVDARVPELKEQTLKGELDFFLTGKGIDSEGLALETLVKERIFLCVPEQWSINENLKDYRVPETDIRDGSSTEKEYPEIPAELIKDCPFVLLEKGLHIRSVADSFFENNGMDVKETLIVGQTMTSLAMTTAGNGICFISDCNLRYGNCKEIPAVYAFDRDLSIREMAAAYKQDKYLSRACREYIRILCENFGVEKIK